MRTLALAALLMSLSLMISAAQQTNPPAERAKKAVPGEKIAPPPPAPEEKQAEPARREDQPRPMQPESPGAADAMRLLKWDMKEVPPVVTHHSITVGAKTLRYTATAGRLPIKDPAGTIEAEMFFVAYTLDGAEPNRRPLTFAFNGGPGSASIWLHMGALGPRKVVLAKEGMMPASPYRLMDNPETPLDRTDIVLVDAIGTGYSRPADMEKGKKFWGVKGDVEAFSEFIRMYISRYERWTSPLYILGESYGTTRAAGIAGFLNNRGISFNGIVLLSMVIDFETLEITKKNDLACVLTLPTYSMIAAYHKKLAPELMQDMQKTRDEVTHWASTDYAAALAKGDALTPQERANIIEQIARYTGLRKDIIDQANLRVDVREFTHWLLADQKLRVGRLDGRYTGPDPNGFFDTPFYDPSGAATGPPFTSGFNDYVRRELGYKTDLPYYVSAGQISTSQEEGFWRKWEWGSAIEGFPDTATPLRAAMVKNPYLKILVMEGYYDLATPFAAADYTMNHLDLGPEYRNNISFATYGAGHMMYVREAELAKVKKDFTAFIDATLPKE
ncbi:MAG: peptidase S10 [Acidobacteriia bacterium]|nr:peptidase S10 [Terriglobia bacterium]